MNYKEILSNGITINYTNDIKFKEIFMSLKIVFEMNPETATTANVLSRMMGDRLEMNPSKQSMSERLDLLYGAQYSSRTYSVGCYQVIDLSTRFIHHSFVNEALLDKQALLLSDLYLSPLLNSETFNEAKKNLKLSLSRIQENPSQYALIEGFKKAGEGQNFGMNSMGDLQHLENLKLDDVKAFHNLCIEQFNKQIFIVGNLDESVNLESFSTGNSTELDYPMLSTKIIEDRVELQYEGNQTELVLVYESSITPKDSLYASYLVYVALLGQLPSSLLFQNIREKHSLCYSIYASRQMFDGIFYIATGINDQNTEKTLLLIEEQVEYLKTNTISVNAAVQYLVMQLEGISESQGSIANQEFRNSILNETKDVSELQEDLKLVTSESVMAVAQLTTKPFIFAYRGEKHEEN